MLVRTQKKTNKLNHHFNISNVLSTDHCAVKFKELLFLVFSGSNREVPKENGDVLSSNSSSEPFVCDICGKTLKHQKSLYSHRRTHTDAKAVCHICGATLKSSRYLHHHLLLHKDIDKPHKCDKCGKAFHSSSALKGNHSFAYSLLTIYYVFIIMCFFKDFL